MFVRNWKGPFITISFTIEMKVQWPNFFTIWIPVRCATKIKSSQNHGLTGSILICAFNEVNSRSTQIKRKSLVVVG